MDLLRFRPRLYHNNWTKFARLGQNFEYDSKNKTIKFNQHKHSFLILDGQHRVYGFSLATTKLRVPVIIYEGLSREEEVTIFIDLNTKQKPVPNELLLDIKKLANAESDQEKYLNDLFDLFETSKESCLREITSASKKVPGKISRVTFKSSFSAIYPKINHLELSKVFSVLNAYLTAFDEQLLSLGVQNGLSNSTILGSCLMLFPEVFQKTKDRYTDDLSSKSFSAILEPIFSSITSASFKKPGNSKREFYQKMTSALKNNVEIDF